MAMPLDTDILTGRTTMRHRLTIYRTHDNDDIEFDVDLTICPTTTDQIAELAKRLKERLQYDIDTPVWTLVVVTEDGAVRGISVPTHQIDHMTLTPLVEATDG